MRNPGETQKGRTSSQNGKQSDGRSEAPQAAKKRSPILAILLVVMGCGVFLFAAWSAMNSPVLASILNGSNASQEQAVPRKSFAQVNIAKPAAMAPVAIEPVVQSVDPTATLAALPEITATQEVVLPEIVNVPPTDLPTLEVAVVPDVATVEQATVAPDTSGQPGAISAEIVVDTPTSEYVAPTAVAFVPVSGNGGEHWIDVNLSEQRVYAYEGDTVVNSFIVSTGTWQTPTVTGKYNIWIKLRSTTMTGPGYYLPNVPYTMYFYKGYGLHGTYWHNNFGTPMSHGCVNLSIPDAEWLYNFSSVGTLVNVHY